MKTITYGKIFTFFLSVFLCLPTDVVLAQRTLVKSFNLMGKTELTIDLGNQVVVVEKWAESLVRVEMEITASNATDRVLKSLIDAGRYNLLGEVSAKGQFVITAPNMKKNVKLGDADLKDQVRYVVFVPKDVNVQIIDNHGIVVTNSF